jgi:hypothetical protein
MNTLPVSLHKGKKMNANEIADELEMVMDGYAIAITASGMLRQQQIEIEALKAEKERLFASMLDMALDSELKDLKYGKAQEK